MKSIRFFMIAILMISTQLVIAGKTDKYLRSGVVAIQHLIKTGDGSYSSFAGLDLRRPIEQALENKTNWDNKKALHDDTLTGIINHKATTLNFEGSDLTGCHMRHVVLPGANFKKTILHKAHIAEAWLQACDFTDADLSNIQASYTKFDYAKMIRSHCVFAHFKNASFEYADLSNMSGQSAQFTRAKLHDANCYQANFSNAILSMMQAQNSDFTEAIFYAAFLDHANVRQSKFLKADFDHANCSYARLNQADMREANFRLASFKGAQLKETNLESIKNYHYSDYEGCRILGAKGHPEVLALITQKAQQPVK